MSHSWIALAGAVLVVSRGALIAQAPTGAGSPGASAERSFARIAILRPNDGDTVDFEAGYIRHLAWHQQANDPWVWYGWNITFGERQRWFVYASFGHSAESLDNPVAPADDERDNVINVVPHAQFVGNAIYEYRPALSRGTGVPRSAARLEFTTVDLKAGAEKAFETAIAANQPTLQDETLWYGMVVGGTAPRYVRLRPRPTLSAVLGTARDQAFPEAVNHLMSKMTIEILTLRPTMSLHLK